MKVETAHRLGAVLTAAYTGTQGRTSALSGQCRKIRVWCSTEAFIAIGGSTVAATTSDTPVAAKTFEYFTVQPGQYVSAIQSAAGGTLYVTELSN